MKKQAEKEKLEIAVKKQPEKKETAAARKKPPQKRVPAVAEKKQPKKRETAAVEERPSRGKGLSPAKKKPSGKREPVATEKKPPQAEVLSAADLGARFKCYKCGTKFYDMGRLKPLCPSCGEDQNNEEAKRILKRKKKRRSAYLAKTEPMIRPPEDRGEVIEVVDELESEFVLDMDDIVLEESTDSDIS